MKPKYLAGTAAVLAAVAVGAGALALSEHQSNELLTQRIDAVEESLTAAVAGSVSVTTGGMGVPSPSGSSLVQTVSSNNQLTAAVAKVAPSVVSIGIYANVPTYGIAYEETFPGSGIRVPYYVETGTEREKISAGTGFFVRENGYIATNNHVVDEPDTEITVLLSNGAEVPAAVVARDTLTDVAIIKVPGSGYRSATFGSSESLVLGQSVFSMGNALGEYSNSVAVGIISGLDRDINALASDGSVEELSGVIQTDAAINPGNSGGPVADLEGRVVGMSVAIAARGQNIGFAIPAEDIQKVIAKNL